VVLGKPKIIFADPIHHRQQNSELEQLRPAGGYPGGVVMRGWGNIVRRLPTAILLLLAISLATLWVRSYWVADEVDYDISWKCNSTFRGSTVGIASGKGHLELDLYYLSMVSSVSLGKEASPRWRHTSQSQFTWPGDFAERSRLGFYVTETSEAAFSGVIRPEDTFLEEHHYGLPDWFPMLPLLALPACTFVRRMKNRHRSARRRRGLCTHCGYDLRMTQDRCPECGRHASK
jgi:hypothetical protein